MLLPNSNISYKQRVYMQKLPLIGLLLIGILVTLITINMNFYSNAMAIENGYVEGYNDLYNNNYENGGYMEERK